MVLNDLHYTYLRKAGLRMVLMVLHSTGACRATCCFRLCCRRSFRFGFRCRNRFCFFIITAGASLPAALAFAFAAAAAFAFATAAAFFFAKSSPSLLAEDSSAGSSPIALRFAAAAAFAFATAAAFSLLDHRFITR